MPLEKIWKKGGGLSWTNRNKSTTNLGSAQWNGLKSLSFIFYGELKYVDYLWEESP